MWTCGHAITICTLKPVKTQSAFALPISKLYANVADKSLPVAYNVSPRIDQLWQNWSINISL